MSLHSLTSTDALTESFIVRSAERRACATLVCSLCRDGVPHHTNSATSIGGADRHPVFDLHAVEDTSGVGLRECLAAPIWERDHRESVCLDLVVRYRNGVGGSAT